MDQQSNNQIESPSTEPFVQHEEFSQVMPQEIDVVEAVKPPKELKEKAKKQSKFFKYLKRLVIFVVLVVSLYLVSAPLLPMAEFHIRNYFDISYDESIIAKVSGSDVDKSDSNSNKNSSDELAKEGDRVVIAGIGVDMPIVLGETEDALDNGSWLRPNGSTPDLGGNTILTAHRFSYTAGDKTFYHLDKMKVGDLVEVYWKGELYTYEVTKSFVVTPDQIEIEAPTQSPQLTLYTCTPLWTAANRLVVIATPVKAEAKEATGFSLN